MKSFNLLIIALIFVACSSRKNEVELALSKYDRFIFNMQADSIANSFWPTGTLGGEGMKLNAGRDSILRFLKSFDPATITLISNSSNSSSVIFRGDSAIQEGTYEQKALMNGDTAVYKGAFTAKWFPNENGKWLLTSMFTRPEKKVPTLKSVLLKQLKTTHKSKEWFVPANVAVEGLTAAQASWTDGSGNHSAGQLTEHLIFWNERVLKQFRGEPTENFGGNNNETFTAYDDKRWEDTVKKLDEIMTSWEVAISKADDKKLADWYETIANMSTHNAYHTGQIIYLRKLQRSWNPEKGVK